MNLKRLTRKVKDAEGSLKEVIAGINNTPIGLYDPEKKTFAPYLGKWVNGYIVKNKLGDYPKADLQDEIAEFYEKEWGVEPGKLKMGINDSFEGGYVYLESQDTGKPIEVDESFVELDPELSGNQVWISDDVYKKIIQGGYPWTSQIHECYWWPCILDQ